MKHLLLIISIMVFAMLSGCSENGTSTDPSNNLDSALDLAMIARPDSPDRDLNDEEAANLIFMREEEKLAHDVYTFLFDLWGEAIFDNIAASEQRHTDRILGLLETYGLEDPVGDNGPGVFSNPDLQELYDALVLWGGENLTEALLVGCTIEEVDIMDLVDCIAMSEHPDVTRVFENLMNGSENHLRCFVTEYETLTGLIYVPLYLDQDVYDVIIAGSSGGGGGQGGGGQGGGGQGGGGQGGSGQGGSGQGGDCDGSGR